MQNSSVSSHGGGIERLGVKLIFYCDDSAVLRTVRTPKNKGKQFWNCPKFKVRSMEAKFTVFFNKNQKCCCFEVSFRCFVEQNE